MGPGKHVAEHDPRKTPGGKDAVALLSIDERIEVVLKYGDITFNSAVEQVAGTLSAELQEQPARYSELQRARVLAGIIKLALGTHEESTSIEHAFQVSGLNATLGAVVYSLSAIHGPERNLSLVSEGLLSLDRELTASVLVEVALHDPSERERARARQWLLERLPAEAANIARQLPDGNQRAMQIQEQIASSAVPATVSSQSVLSDLQRDAVRRIFPAIQQVLSGSDLTYRVHAIQVLEQEIPLYAIPLLTLVTQVHDSEVREAGLQALERTDPVTARSLQAGAPTFLSRVVGFNTPQTKS